MNPYLINMLVYVHDSPSTGMVICSAAGVTQDYLLHSVYVLLAARVVLLRTAYHLTQSLQSERRSVVIRDYSDSNK